jgi:endogenous inhibitor of DNA gyrase (YacG/DUF329 family)
MPSIQPQSALGVVGSDSSAKATTEANPVASNASIRFACEECGTLFQPYRTKIDRYCSDKCKLDAWAANHVRLHRADLFTVIGKDWQAKLAAARLARKAKEMMR